MANVIPGFEDSPLRYTGTVNTGGTGGSPLSPLVTAIREQRVRAQQQAERSVMQQAALSGAGQQAAMDAAEGAQAPNMAQRFQEQFAAGARAVRQSQLRNESTARMAEIVRQTQDPGEAMALWSAYRNEFLESVSNDPEFRIQAQQTLDQMGVQTEVRLLDREREQQIRRQSTQANEANAQFVANAGDLLLNDPDQETLYEVLGDLQSNLADQVDAGLITSDAALQQYQRANTALTTEWLFGTFQQRMEDGDLEGAVALVNQLDQEGMYFDNNEDGRRLAARLRQRLPNPTEGHGQSVRVSLDVLNRGYDQTEDGLGVNDQLQQEAFDTVMAFGTDTQRQSAVEVVVATDFIRQLDEALPFLGEAGVNEVEGVLEEGLYAQLPRPAANAIRKRLRDRQDLVRRAETGDYLAVAEWDMARVQSATVADFRDRQLQAASVLQLPVEMMPVMRNSEIRQLATDYNDARLAGNFDAADAVVNRFFTAFEGNPSGLGNAVLQSGSPDLALQVNVSNMGTPADSLTLRQAQQVAAQPGVPRYVDATDIREDSDIRDVVRAMAMGDPAMAAGIMSTVIEAANGFAVQAQQGGLSERRAGAAGLEQLKSVLSASSQNVVQLESGAVLPGYMLTDSPSGTIATVDAINDQMADPMVFGFGARDNDMVDLYITPRPLGNGVVGYFNTRTGSYVADPNDVTMPLTVDAIELSPPPGQEPDTRGMFRRGLDNFNERIAQQPQQQAVRMAQRQYPNTAPIIERFGLAAATAKRSLPAGTDPQFGFAREAAYDAVGERMMARFDRTRIPMPIDITGASGGNERMFAPAFSGLVAAEYWNHVSAKYDEPLPAMYAYVMGEAVVDQLYDGQPGWYKQIPDANVHSMVEKLLLTMEANGGE